MPLIALVHLAVAAFFGVHAIRTGRPYYWLFILFSFPMLGSVVYFFAIYLPGMQNTRGGRKAVRAVQNLVDPNRELREAHAEFDRTPTAYNRARLGAALLAKGQVDEAIAHFAQAASGPYARDAAFLQGLAGAQLEGQRFSEAAATLERLFEAHPDRRAGTSTLLYAEALAGAGRAEARQAFETAIASEPTIEARSRYGLFLLEQGDKSRARGEFEAVMKDVQRGHHHSRELNREWIDKVNVAMKTLSV